MTHPPSRVLMQWLIDQGHFTMPYAETWPLWNSFFPESEEVPDQAGAIYDEIPQLDARVSSGEIIQHPGVSLYLRSLKHDTGWVKMFNIQEALSLLNDAAVTVNSTDYTIHTVINLSGVIPLGLEKGTRRRRLFVMNLMVSMTEL